MKQVNQPSHNWIALSVIAFEASLDLIVLLGWIAGIFLPVDLFAAVLTSILTIACNIWIAQRTCSTQNGTTRIQSILALLIVTCTWSITIARGWPLLGFQEYLVTLSTSRGLYTIAAAWAFYNNRPNDAVTPLGLLTDTSNRKRHVSTTIEKESAERLGQNHPPKPLDSNMKEKKRKVFVSHSSIDKPFVERIVKELESRHLQVWFDKYEMGVGDSIVQGINQGLSDADYFLLILSPNSVKSIWVQRELNAALMEETSKRGIVVLPAIIEDCEIPILVRDRIYADFRSDFDIGLNGLLRVLNQESATALSIEPDHKVMFASSDCKSNLSALSLAELRRRMSKRMGRSEVSTVWFDVFESLMDNDMIGRTLTECVVELLDRAKNRNKLADVIVSVCSDRDDIGAP